MVNYLANFPRWWTVDDFTCKSLDSTPPNLSYDSTMLQISWNSVTSLAWKLSIHRTSPPSPIFADTLVNQKENFRQYIDLPLDSRGNPLSLESKFISLKLSGKKIRKQNDDTRREIEIIAEKYFHIPDTIYQTHTFPNINSE